MYISVYIYIYIYMYIYIDLYIDLNIHTYHHLLAAPELTREQSAIFRIKGEKIQIF